MPTPRFLTLDDVAEILNVSWSQAYALVRRKELIAIQIGGRGQWRVEVEELDTPLPAAADLDRDERVRLGPRDVEDLRDVVEGQEAGRGHRSSSPSPLAVSLRPSR